MAVTTTTEGASTFCAWWAPDFCHASTFTAAEWASWIQAIGSILAIVVAALLARYQFKQALRVEQVNRDEERKVRVDVVKSLFAQVLSLCNLTYEGLQTGDAVPPLADDAHYFERCISQFETLPLLEIPSGELAVYVINAPAGIRKYIAALIEGDKQALLYPKGTMPGEYLGKDFRELYSHTVKALNLCHRFLGEPEMSEATPAQD